LWVIIPETDKNPMPTNKDRLNISIVDSELIKELIDLRKYMERDYDGRFSYSDVIKSLIMNRPNVDKLIDSLTIN
jgi:hypothetical protein